MKRLLACVLALLLILSLAACGSQQTSTEQTGEQQTQTPEQQTAQPQATETAQTPSNTADETDAATETADHSDIEDALNLANMGAEWTYSENAGAWTLSVVTAVTNAELPDYQGVSVCVPGAYVKGVDTDGDGAADATSGTVTGNLVIDYDASVTSTNGQIYTAATAPVIINTGAAGYSAQSNQTAGSTYAAEGYINVACGNRGKQSTLSDGNYTGDAPSCLVDQKNTVRFVKFNILLGNLPGSVDHFVSTGGSGGGAHATMLAATSDNPDFYDYQIASGAVGIYQNDDGSYDTSVTVDGERVALSDGMWGCMAYSAITSLAEADMALAFEYTQDSTYSFNTSFQKLLAVYLSAEYMDYINSKNLSVSEAAVGFDLNSDGDMNDTVALTVEYDEATGSYSGTYLDLYLAEFIESFQSYLNRLDYAEGWTWFDAEGIALSDDAVAAMSTGDKAVAFIEGRYAKGSSAGGMGGMEGAPGGDSTGGPPSGEAPGGEAPDGAGGPDGSDSAGGPPDMSGGAPGDGDAGTTEEVGTPDAGTTQSATSKTDSANYASFAEMLAAYQADIAEIEAGDAYGNNIVELYNPINYIGAEGTSDPAWARVLMGASEGDISMLNSLNLEIAWLNAGTDAMIEWQWNGGHVPSEVMGDSFSLYVDMMYGKHVAGAVSIERPAAAAQTVNGTAESATGTDISSWIDYSDIENISFTLADIAAYRTSGASKATPGFDVMDYGQEDYVFGSSAADARHWSKYVLRAFEENADALSALFNAG